MKINVRWLLPVLICIIASVASVFLPILSYDYPNGISVSFDIFDFIKPAELTKILSTYSGSIKLNIDQAVATFLAIAAVLSIILAFIGVITMSLQRSNTWQFILTLVGIIGTAIPSIIIFIVVILSRSYFPGTFSFGVYPIITPIAMVLCMITVTQKHKKTQAEILAEEKAKGLIRRAGDL